MGAKQTRQQICFDSNCQCGSHNEKRSWKWTASDFGSWTKLSLTSQSPPMDTSESSGVVPRQDSECSSTRSVGSDAQPISSTKECLIREVVPKLLDVGPNVLPHQKKDSATSLALSPTGSAMEPITPGKAAALHYSLCMTPELSPSEAQRRKKIIAKSFLEHMECLIEQVQPDQVAQKLYGIAVLDIDELRHASDKQEAEEDRARELVRLLKRKLWRSPEWFVDVCKILRNCGVKVISQVIDEVYSECPTEEMSILSTGSFSGSTSTFRTSIQTRKTSVPSYHDMIKKIEDAFREGGLQAATVRVQKYSMEQGVDTELVHGACQCGVSVSTLDLLLSILDQTGDNLITNSKAECGRTPLHEACAGLRPGSADEEADALEGNSEQRLKIELLMTHGANHCAKDKDGNTPLHLAVLRRDCEAVSSLLRSGRRCINIVNKCGNTALHMACRRGQVDIVKVLCSHRANTSTQNNKTRTALHLACIHNHIDAAVELASHDQSTLDAFDKYHMTPLHICCKKDNSLLAVALLRLKNCSVFKVDKDNKTPLHYAVAQGNVSLVTALLQKDGASTGGTKGLLVDAQDKYGDTALHMAGRHGNKPIAKQLLNYRADKDILNQEGKNPLEVAIDCEHDQVAVKLIRKRGWHQRRKTMRRVYKLRRTLTQSTLVSTTYQSEASDNVGMSSSESEDDENVGRMSCCEMRSGTL